LATTPRELGPIPSLGDADTIGPRSADGADCRLPT